MHMASEIVGPVVAGAGYVVSGTAVAYSAYRLRKEGSQKVVPMLSVVAAFVFAAQMVNFPVGPSSGHLGGGVLIAALLGPWAAILGLAAVLAVQCLVFADGGLLALGLNIFNMGVLPAFIFVAISKALAGVMADEKKRRVAAGVVGAYAAVLLGSVLVPFEVSYAKVSIPFMTFLGWMVGIHALIGIGEALITGTALGVLMKVRPGAFVGEEKGVKLLPVAGGLLIVALLVGTVVSNFASSMPDGLEMSIEKSQTAAAVEEGAAAAETETEEKGAVLPTAVMPDYATPGIESEFISTGVAGFVGTVITFIIAFIAIRLAMLRRRKGGEEAA